MENASKALIIADAILLSVMIISLLVYTGRSFGLIAKAEQDAKLAQDKKNFNLQYEIYDKSLMYGTDVLSCLNKAQSNNQKYVNQNYYGTENLGSEYRQEYLIDVEVTLKKTIQERITVYKLRSNGKKEQLPMNQEAKPTTKMFKNNHFKVPKLNWYYFKNGQIYKGESTETTYPSVMWNNYNSVLNYNLKTIEINTKLTAGTYRLLNEAGSNNIGKLSALLSTATEVEQTIINESYGSSTTSGGTSDDWYSAVWRTAAYDFKTRKFKCTGLTYNEETGYISKISFEEILPYE